MGATVNSGYCRPLRTSWREESLLQERRVEVRLIGSISKYRVEERTRPRYPLVKRPGKIKGQRNPAWGSVG